jgi:hypothetical protein
MKNIKTFLLWMLLTDILYIICNYITRKVIYISNQSIILILYDIAVSVGVLWIIYLYISKTIPLKEILQKHYKLFTFVSILLGIGYQVVAKYILYNPYVCDHLLKMPYDTYQIIAKFLYGNLQISIVYIILLYLAFKGQNEA